MKNFTLFLTILFGVWVQGHVGFAEEDGTQILDSYPADGEVIKQALGEREYRPINLVNPKYPDMALLNNKDGYVLVQFTVDKEGMTKDIIILEESPKGYGFGKASLKVVKEYKYEPFLIERKPVELTGVKTRITFQINN